MRSSNGLNAYKSHQTRTRAEVANPYQMVKILFENLTDNMARARGAITQNNPVVRGECIGRSMDIINALIDGLDHSVISEVSHNLENLYKFCNQRLTEAAVRNDTQPLDDAADIIQQLKSAWDQLESQSNAAS